MPTTDYHIEMQVVPNTSVPTPQDAVAITERFVLPTLEAFERLVAEGRIVAGGPALGGTKFSFILRVDAPHQVEDVVAALPLWPRSHTVVTPLGRFADRTAMVRGRLARLKAASASAATEPVRA